MDKILVTGGCGFIGSNYIYHVLRNNLDTTVVNIDSLTYAGNKQNNERVFEDMVDDRYFFYQASITDVQMMEEIIRHEEPEWVVNFAAESHVTRSAWGATPFFKSNVIGVYNLLTLGVKYGYKFLHISTDEVYGSVDKGEVDEETALRPGNLYAASKAAADLLCIAFERTWDYPIFITRSANNYGPYQHPEKFVPLAISNLIEGNTIPLYDGGKHIRDWLHVEDNCRGIEVVRKAQVPGIYNIGAGNYRTVNQVAERICRHLGYDPLRSLKSIPDRPGNDFRYGIDSSKIQALGWRPEYTNFNVDVGDTIDWYMNHKAWWRQIKRSLEWARYYEDIHMGVRA